MDIEWEVNYKNGGGWEPIDEATMRRRLAGRYGDVDAVVELMKTEGDIFNANTGFAIYRHKPAHVVGPDVIR